MDKREMLEWAARAARIEVKRNTWLGRQELLVQTNSGDLAPWDPLEDNGDAFSLAVALEIDIAFSGSVVLTWSRNTFLSEEPLSDDPEAAVRRAIVRAAMGIGKANG